MGIDDPGGEARRSRRCGSGKSVVVVVISTAS